MFVKAEMWKKRKNFLNLKNFSTPKYAKTPKEFLENFSHFKGLEKEALSKIGFALI